MKKILSCICDEPKGSIERSVYLMEMSRENIHILWEKCSQFPILFTSPVGSFEQFVNRFLYREEGEFLPRGLVWVLDDFVGIYHLTNIIPGEDALVHYSFFDKRHKGRELISLLMLQYAFNEFSFQRLSVEIPTYAKEFSFNFIKSLGFKEEGVRRNSAWYQDKWFPKMLFGILRDECLSMTEPKIIENHHMTATSSPAAALMRS
jgi:RimJ/RimL family protein N-acetyltransferase